MSTHLEYEQKGMPFRRLGPSGLRVPVFSLGGWLTIGEKIQGDPVKEIMKTAFENGISMFDTAEGYGAGSSEEQMGRAIKELGIRRSDLIITTKIFYGTREGPNDTGLSRKHIIEGTKASLERLQMEYVDVIFAHRPDPSVPMEETVRAFNFVIEKGWAFYWGTSEWSAAEIEEAHHIAAKLNLIAPVAEQCKHNLLERERAEKEYQWLYKKYGLSTTVFSALESGILTGKYNDGIPESSRLHVHSEFLKSRVTFLSSEEGKAAIEKVKLLTKVAEEELNCTTTHLALAWVAKNPNTSTVILGATSPAQVLDNLKAIEVLNKLTPELMEKIDEIMKNKPNKQTVFARNGLDPTGRQ